MYSKHNTNNYFSNALITRKDMAVFYSRSGSLALVMDCFIILTSLFAINLDKVVGLHGGLFNITYLTLQVIILIMMLIIYIMLYHFILEQSIIIHYVVYRSLYLQHKVYILKKWESFCYFTFIVTLPCISLYVYEINTSSLKLVTLIISLSSGLLLLLSTMADDKKKVDLLDTLYYILRNKINTLLILLLFRIVMYLVQLLLGYGLDIPPIAPDHRTLVRCYIYITSLFPCLYIFHFLSQIRYIPNWFYLNKVSSSNNKDSKTRMQPSFSPLAVKYSIFQLLLLSSSFVIFQVWINPFIFQCLNVYYTYFSVFFTNRLAELLNYKCSCKIRIPNIYLLTYRNYNCYLLPKKSSILHKACLDNPLFSAIDMHLVYKANKIYIAKHYNSNINKESLVLSKCYNKYNSNKKSLLKYTPNLGKVSLIHKNITTESAYLTINYPKINLLLYDIRSTYSRDIIRLRSFVTTDLLKLVDYHSALHEVFVRRTWFSSDASLVVINTHITRIYYGLRRFAGYLHKYGLLWDYFYIINKYDLTFQDITKLNLLSLQVDAIDKNFSLLYGFLGLLFRHKPILNSQQCRYLNVALTIVDREYTRYTLIRKYFNYTTSNLFKWEIMVADDIEKIHDFLIQFSLFKNATNNYRGYIGYLDNEIMTLHSILNNIKHNYTTLLPTLIEANVILNKAISTNVLEDKYKFDYENLYLISQLPNFWYADATISTIYRNYPTPRPDLSNIYFYQKVVRLEKSGVTEFKPN